MMSKHLLTEAGPTLVLADFHYDAYLRRGLDPFVTNGLQALVGPHYAAIIIAGDLINDPKSQLGPALRWLIKLFAPAPVFFLPGNHDFYSAGIDEEDVLREITADAGATYAQKLELVQGDTRFLMATLWTDFGLRGDPAAAMRVAWSRMNDHPRISMPSNKAGMSGWDDPQWRPRSAVTPAVLRQIHFDHRDWIERRLVEPFNGRSVVVSHHAPHPAAQGAIDGLSPAFGSDLSDMILRYQPDLWLFGHTHQRLWAQISRTVVRNVSVGYPGEHSDGATPDFIAGCVVSPASWG